MNSVNMSGRLTADPKVSKTRDGVSYMRFTLAVKRPKSKDKTDFIRCSCFRQTADYLEKYAAKGAKVELTGIITSSTYTDRNGNEVTSIEVAAEEVNITEKVDKQQFDDTDGFVADSDDLPF